MRVCLASFEFAPFHGAGIGTYASLMAAAWAGAGHEVHVLTGNHPGVMENGPRLRPGVHFHAVDPSGEAPHQPMGTRAERYALGVLRELERLHGEHHFDYIEFPDFGGEGAYATWARRASGALAGAVLGIRLHTPTRECRALNGESWLDEEVARAEALEDGAIRRADILISPSASLLEIVRARLGRATDWPREAVVPYPFDRAAMLELLPPGPAAPPPAGAPSGPPVVLYYGRLERRKGVHLLVGAARRMIESGIPAHFRLIGGDTATGPGGSSMRAHLEGLAGPWAGERVRFEPARSRAALGEEVRRAALVCVPSLWENFPNVVLESMALGACVVGSAAGGIAEIIRDGRDGLLFRAGDGDDLERILRGALADGGLRRTLAAAAPGRIAGLCDPAAVVAQTLSAIEIARCPDLRPGGAPGAPGKVSVLIEGDGPGLEETLRSVHRQGSPVLELHVSDRQAGAAAAPTGEWVLALRPGDVLAEAALDRLLAVGARNPAASWVGGLSTGDGGLAVGLDRDLMASGAPPGPGLARRSALERLGAGREWISAPYRLAAADEPWVLAPEAVVQRAGGVPIAPPMADPIGLAADPARVARILVSRMVPVERARDQALAQCRALAERIERLEKFGAAGEPPPGPARPVHHEAVYRQRLMEANLRYRLADAASAALKAAGVRRPLKALARAARAIARGLVGG